MSCQTGSERGHTWSLDSLDGQFICQVVFVILLITVRTSEIPMTARWSGKRKALTSGTRTTYLLIEKGGGVGSPQLTYVSFQPDQFQSEDNLKYGGMTILGECCDSPTTRSQLAALEVPFAPVTAL